MVGWSRPEFTGFSALTGLLAVWCFWICCFRLITILSALLRLVIVFLFVIGLCGFVVLRWVVCVVVR